MPLEINMRILAIGAALLLAFVTPALAQETPKALIEAIYAPYIAGQIPEDEAALRSEALNALYEADMQRSEEGEIGALDFDPYIDGQDFEITDLEIDEPIIDGSRGTVRVTFKNFGQPREMIYSVVIEAEAWKIDDLESLSAEYPYRLTAILADPLLN